MKNQIKPSEKHPVAIRIFALIVVVAPFIWMYSCINDFFSIQDEKMQESLSERTEIIHDDPLGLGEDSLKNMIGVDTPFELWPVWGSPQTLPSTNVNYWVIYLGKANVSMVIDKKEQIVVYSELGNNAGDYLSLLQSVRKALISKCFSTWDGSHKTLKQAVIATM